MDMLVEDGSILFFQDVFFLADDHSVFFFPGGNGDSVGNIISKEEFPASHV